MAVTDMRALNLSDHDSTDPEVTYEKSRPLKRATVVVLALALCGCAFALAPAGTMSGFLHASSGDVVNFEEAPAPKWFLVRHLFKSEGVIDGWWAKMQELSTPEKFHGMQDALSDHGFRPAIMLPVGVEGPMFCIWQAEAGKTLKDMEKFIDTDPASPALPLINQVHEIMPAYTAMLPTLLGQDPKDYFGRRLEGSDPSSWFLIWHEFKKTTDKGAWWKGINEMLADKDKFAAFTKANADKGFHNLLFMPLSEDGPCVCLWELAPGKTQKDLKEFALTGGLTAFNNHIMPVMPGTVPMKPFF